MVRLVDAQQQHKESPGTFWAPSDEELDVLQPGDFVKICLGGERFWVVVITVDGDVITGIVNNTLINTKDHGYKLYDEINLERRHVYDYIINAPDEVDHGR